LLAGVILFLFAACLMPAAGWSAGKSYPMVCRGGGSMWVESWRNGIQIHFRGASAGSSQRQPGPGECAWLDRGFRPGEPTMLTWYPRSIDTFIVKINSRGTVTGYDIRGGAAGNYRYLLDNALRGSVFYVHAYRPTGAVPQLRITRIGP